MGDAFVLFSLLLQMDIFVLSLLSLQIAEELGQLLGLSLWLSLWLLLSASFLKKPEAELIAVALLFF
jgi:hypothetical protein